MFSVFFFSLFSDFFYGMVEEGAGGESLPKSLYTSFYNRSLGLLEERLVLWKVLKMEGGSYSFGNWFVLIQVRPDVGDIGSNVDYVRSDLRDQGPDLWTYGPFGSIYDRIWEAIYGQI